MSVGNTASDALSKSLVQAAATAATATDVTAALTAITTTLQALPDRVTAQVITTLLSGKSLAGFPDDMGVPPEFRLGQPAQNFFVWPALIGATMALQSPENLLLIAVMLDAMAKAANDPVARIAAAQNALTNAKRILHG